MNNEPVAWVDPYDLERLPHYDCHIGSQKMKNGIPLYTHPVKELTDEEIADLIANKVTDSEMIKQALRKAQGDV